jgi:hypothetical protein
MNDHPRELAQMLNISPINYAMHRILHRQFAHREPFAMFALGDGPSIVNSTSKKYSDLLAKNLQYLIGIYNRESSAEIILEDLKEFYE